MVVKALKVVLICAVIGLCFGIYLYFTFDHHLSRIVTSVLSSVTIGSFMTLAIYFRSYFTDITSLPSLKVLIIIGLLMLAAILGSELTLFLRAAFFNSKYVFFGAHDVYILNILIALVTGIPMYINDEWRNTLNSRVLNQQFKLLQMQQQHTTFELELLRAKINPHFLYNVHNSIAGLISKDPQKAEKMVLLLSKFFRFTLSKSSATYHTVADEVDIIKTYLELQSIRYEDRLSYDINVDDTLLNMQMPSFIIQPLVENSIKHGIEKISGKGSVIVNIFLSAKALHAETFPAETLHSQTLHAEILPVQKGNVLPPHKDHKDKYSNTGLNFNTERLSTAQQIIIQVADTGADFPELPGTGVGLQSVNNKLRILYKEDFSITFNKLPEKHVEIIFPKGN